MIDIHNHLIWGIDDGAENEEETLVMAEAAVEDGIDIIITTPHITPGVYKFPYEDYEKNYQRTQQLIREHGLNLTLYPGAEVLYTETTPRLIREGKVPTLANGRYLLLEFAPGDSEERITDGVQKVSACGVIPVIAHLERCLNLRKTEQVRMLRERYGATVQINCRSLTYKQPLLRRKYFDRLFEERLVDFLATDTHAMVGRETCMTLGCRLALEKYGIDFKDSGKVILA